MSAALRLFYSNAHEDPPRRTACAPPQRPPLTSMIAPVV